VARFKRVHFIDWRLWRQDILGSKAHAQMLHKIGILSRGSWVKSWPVWMRSGNRSRQENSNGGRSGGCSHEHRNRVDAANTSRAKLHTGRSRTTRWHWICASGCGMKSTGCWANLLTFKSALIVLGEKHGGSRHPGLHALQRAQPVTLHTTCGVRGDARRASRERLQESLRRIQCLSFGQRRDCRFHSTAGS